MDNVSWIKIQTDIFRNRKIRVLQTMPNGDSLVLMWFRLLVLAGETNDRGLIYFTARQPYTAKMLAADFGTDEDLIKTALSTFKDFEMLTVDRSGLIEITNWEEYQNSERLDEIREQNRIRAAKRREKAKKTSFKRDEERDKSVTSALHERDESVTVTQSHATEEEKEIDIESFSNEKDGDARAHARETAPTVDEIERYVKEKGYSVSAQRFHSYYSNRGWTQKDGTSMIGRWRTILDAWAVNGIEDKQPPGKPTRRAPKNAKTEHSSFDTDDFFNAAVRASYSDDQIDELVSSLTASVGGAG